MTSFKIFERQTNEDSLRFVRLVNAPSAKDALAQVYPGACLAGAPWRRLFWTPDRPDRILLARRNTGDFHEDQLRQMFNNVP